MMSTVQLDFSWTLKMSDQQNDRFARSSEGLSISPSATLHHSEALSLRLSDILACKLILLLSVGHFEGPTEVHLNSW